MPSSSEEESSEEDPKTPPKKKKGPPAWLANRDKKAASPVSSTGGATAPPTPQTQPAAATSRYSSASSSAYSSACSSDSDSPSPVPGPPAKPAGPAGRKPSSAKPTANLSAARPERKGVLEVRVKAAASLQPADGPSGQCDPCVQVMLPGFNKWRSTSTRTKTTDPTWHEEPPLRSCEAPLRELLARPLSLQVSDKRSGAVLGKLQVDLAPLQRDEAVQLEAAPLTDAPGGGTLSLSVKWAPSPATPRLTEVVA